MRCVNAHAGRDPMLLACAVCGAPFAPTAPRQRHCDQHLPEPSPTTQARGPAYYAARRRLLTPAPGQAYVPCHWCGAPADTADHIIPVARGGTLADGLWPACKPCNSSRQTNPKPRPPSSRTTTRRPTR